MPGHASAETRIVFVTGGVSSSLGKGIAAASLGRLLVDRGLTVRNMKLDPYLNVDPGTLAPGEHGEVFVLGDGTEVDLDAGHYERFVGTDLDRHCSVTSGQILLHVLTAERDGAYLGRTVQVVPHVTDEIKRRILLAASASGPVDVLVVEVGGTVGDIEILPFMEAIRQLRADLGPYRTCAVHLTLIPAVGPSQELKTKPSQHSVAEMRSQGVHPDVLVARSTEPLDDHLRTKLANTCGVPQDRVISAFDARSIYQVPSNLAADGFDTAVCQALDLTGRVRSSADWDKAVANLIDPPLHKVSVAVAAKYLAGSDTYLSVIESLRHAAAAHGTDVDVVWVDAEDLERGAACLDGVDAVVVPGGFGSRGVEGKILAARHCRTSGLPYLGLCLGLQIAVVDFARDVAGITDAVSAEWEWPGTPVVALLDSQQEVTTMGGTMRLGYYDALLTPGSKTAALYGTTEVRERHRHRYEVNPDLRPTLEEAGLGIAGSSPDGHLVEFIELTDHPYFVATQAHPELLSRPGKPHPLFSGLIAAALARRS